MAEPGFLPWRGEAGFDAGTRETVRGRWEEALLTRQVNVR